MANLFDKVLEVLKEDQRFFAEDGTFLRNAVYEAAMQMDAELIRMLLSNKETKERFFQDIELTIVSSCRTAIRASRTRSGLLMRPAS